MLTIQDCIAFSGLTQEQLEAVAHHQHLPDVVAAEWAETMLEDERGVRRIEAALYEEVAHARCRHDPDCMRRYQRALEDFLRDHPRA